MSPSKASRVIFDNVNLYNSNRFNDYRGFLQQIYDKEFLEDLKISNLQFSLSYFSYSKKNVLRGLHFQRDNSSQKKMITLIKGRIFDVIVDIRPCSPTYGKYKSEILDANNVNMIWIPEGFAHGFQALDKENIMLYQIIGDYQPDDEITLNWNDSDLQIEWPNKKGAVISHKDENGIFFRNLSN